MSREFLANNAQTTLSAAITTTGATSCTVTSATAFPASGTFRVLVDSELMSVTGVSGTTFTIVRGIEGSTAATHSNGATVSQVITAAGLLAAGATANALSAALASEYVITGTMANVGLSIALPEAGTYLLTEMVRIGFSLNGTVGEWGTVTVQLYDTAAIPNSIVSHTEFLPIASTTLTYSILATRVLQYVASAPVTLQLQATYTTNATISNEGIYSDSTGGYTVITAVRLF